MTSASGPLGGHLVHVVPLLVPGIAFVGVFGPDLARRAVRAVRRRADPGREVAPLR